jgi:hypothetical protein
MMTAIVYPAHHAGSAQRNLALDNSSTLGNERMGNWLSKQTKGKFIKTLLE